MIKGKRKIIKKKFKEHHKKQLIKYDTNKDGLITLDEYLSKEISAGPNAKPSSINYNYQNYENIFNYFMIVFLRIKKFKIMCIPNFILRYLDYAIRTALAYNIESDELYYSDSMKSSLIKCAVKDNVRFIFFSFIIIPSRKAKLTHANMVVIDLLKKTYERFEPHGKGRFTKKLDDLFQVRIRNLLDIFHLL